jgi:nitrile hydratase
VQDLHRDLHDHLPPDPALRVKALESLLVAKGMLDRGAVDAWIELYADEIGPKRGARVVARAWLDVAFKARLLRDANDALKDFGFAGWGTAHVRVVENTEAVHNLVVCTLCSCYPHAVLGIPPAWYKSAPYRARAVRDPRGVLAEFGLDLPGEVEIRVWDSTSEFRYMVLPQRPNGTEGWDEERLAAIVRRNAMIGTERVRVPA